MATTKTRSRKAAETPRFAEIVIDEMREPFGQATMGSHQIVNYALRKHPEEFNVIARQAADKLSQAVFKLERSYDGLVNDVQQQPGLRPRFEEMDKAVSVVWAMLGEKRVRPMMKPSAKWVNWNTTTHRAAMLLGTLLDEAVRNYEVQQSDPRLTKVYQQMRELARDARRQLPFAGDEKIGSVGSPKETIQLFLSTWSPDILNLFEKVVSQTVWGDSAQRKMFLRQLSTNLLGAARLLEIRKDDETVKMLAARLKGINNSLIRLS